MNIICPNPSCDQQMSGPKSLIGQRFSCPACGQSFIWTDCFHSGESFVIYDLETTGLYPDSDEFIQIAAVRFQSGCLCPGESFFSYALPRRRIPAFITSYTGITNDHVRDAPHPEAVLRSFARWSGDATLIAHNGLRFDSKFLAATCQRHGLPTREVQSIDSIHMSKMLFGNARGTGHSMDHLISRLKINCQGILRHDARGDVEILGRAVAALRTRLDLDLALNGVRRHSSFLPIA